MRISTSMLYQNGSSQISDLQSSLAKTQEQLSSNRRVLTPSDDPIAAAQALVVTQSQAVNTQQATNRNTAKDSLTQVDTTLSSMTDLLTAAKSQIVAAGNGTLNDSQRSYIATNLSGQLQQILSLANTKDGTGNYLFSGYQTNTQPFTQTATGAQYNGDQGQRMVQVGSSRQMAISETGQAIFQGGGQDMFKTITDAINLLNTPTNGNTTALQAGLATANSNLDTAITNVSTVQTSVGSRLSELDALDNTGQAFDVQYTKTLSNLQDLDYAKAISQLSQQQMTLEAAQKSFTSITGLSLFNYINP